MSWVNGRRAYPFSMLVISVVVAGVWKPFSGLRSSTRYDDQGLGDNGERSADWSKARAIVGDVIADHMRADRSVRIELRTLRTAP